jgi:hypothetical protein
LLVHSFSAAKLPPFTKKDTRNPLLSGRGFPIIFVLQAGQILFTETTKGITKNPLRIEGIAVYFLFNCSVKKKK